MTLANKLTLVRLALIPAFIAFMLLDLPLVALVIFVLASLTDKLDGYVARKYNQITDLGKIMDPLADKLLVFSALVLFVAEGLVHPVALLLILTRELLITSMRTVLAGKGKIMAAAWAGKLKTVVQMVVIIALLCLPSLNQLGITALESVRMPLSNILGWVTAAVTVWSGIDYICHGMSLKGISK